MDIDGYERINFSAKKWFIVFAINFILELQKYETEKNTELSMFFYKLSNIREYYCNTQTQDSKFGSLTFVCILYDLTTSFLLVLNAY